MLKRILNKKGASTIEFAVCLLIFIMIFSYIFDLVLITYKQYAVADHANQIIRQIAQQSGVRYTTPDYFPGGHRNYYTTTELYDSLDERMSNLGVSEKDWSVIIRTTDTSLPSQLQDRFFGLKRYHYGLNSNYGDYISVEITYNYEWGLWSQFVPGVGRGTTVVERSAFSEYNHDLSE